MNRYNKLIFGIVIGIMLGISITALILSLCFYPKNVAIFNKNIEKVVEIRCSSDNEAWGYATGCFIDSSGTILTNKHVVKNNNSSSTYEFIDVRMANNTEWIKAYVVKLSEKADLAILKADLGKVKFFKLADNVENGDKAYTIGNPNGYGLSFLEGVISSSLREVQLYGESHMMTQTSFVINGGNSGGPVFNALGKLIGLMSFRIRDNMDEVIQGVSFAVPLAEIKSFTTN